MTVGDYNETSFALYRKEITLDPTEALRLGETRREEATAAQGLLGVTPKQIVFFGLSRWRRARDLRKTLG